MRDRIKNWWDSVLDIGSIDDETSSRRGVRRIVVGYFVIGAASRTFATVAQAADGTIEAWVDFGASVASLVLLACLWRWPKRFVLIVNIALFVILMEVLTATLLTGGIVEANLVILWGMLAVVGALIVLPIRYALLWAVGYVVTLGLGVVLPTWIESPEVGEWSASGVAGSVLGVTVFVFAGMAYFVRQRNRLQAESDDLLHNILPDEIAERLKRDPSLIADAFSEVSILFADVVDFTPMSASMEPSEVVGLLNSLFSTFDEFVEELGLEKIKTVGDAYMVASGVPVPRRDHAHAIAELALRIRDHTRSHTIDGRRITMRIGINSGSVVAGIVGIHKFAYDLWGDVVNTASRMESSGVPDEIQMTATTRELVKDRFECAHRGMVDIKGKGQMETWFLSSKR